MSNVTVSARTSGKSVVALVLGLLSPVLLITTGLPALLVGFFALREINRSDGRLRGRGLAVAGMVLGGLGSAAVVLWLAATVLSHFQRLGYRTTCANNLRVIGLAINVYYDEHQTYPAGTVPNDGLLPDQRLSWMVSVLPYLPEGPGRHGPKPKTIYDAIDRKVAWDAPANIDAVSPSLRWFLCPSDLGSPPDQPPRRPGLTSYVGMAGVGADAAGLPATDPKAGVFGYDRRITRKDVVAGLSQTILATETSHDNGPWAAGGPATVRALVPGEEPYIGVGRPFGGCHPGGLNVLFLDGQVRFIQETMPPATLEALATIGND